MGQQRIARCLKVSFVVGGVDVQVSGLLSWYLRQVQQLLVSKFSHIFQPHHQQSLINLAHSRHISRPDTLHAPEVTISYQWVLLILIL